MSDRLAEIERLREAAGIPTPMRVVSFPDDEYGGTWELHLEGDTSEVWGQDYATAYTAEIAAYLAALVNNADWLIARVRALEAQAEADAEVREAARNAMIAADEYMRPDPATHVPFSLRYRRFESAMNLLRGQVSDAALAARKGE